MENIIYKWCTTNDSSSVDRLAELFVENAANNKEYISHGEVIVGRANNLNEWKSDIKAIMRDEFANAIHSTFDSPNVFTMLAIATHNEVAIALALVDFHPETKVAILSDIVVDASLRGRKIGESMLDWIEVEAKKWGAKYIFLESGISNQSAHHFFERMGFHTSSMVMVKEISAVPHLD